MSGGIDPPLLRLVRHCRDLAEREERAAAAAHAYAMCPARDQHRYAASVLRGVVDYAASLVHERGVEMFETEAEYRRAVLDLLGRLAETEERLCADAEREGEETMSLVHEHGGMCLREAQGAVLGLGHA